MTNLGKNIWKERFKQRVKSEAQVRYSDLTRDTFRSLDRLINSHLQMRLISKGTTRLRG